MKKIHGEMMVKNQKIVGEVKNYLKNNKKKKL